MRLAMNVLGFGHLKTVTEKEVRMFYVDLLLPFQIPFRIVARLHAQTIRESAQIMALSPKYCKCEKDFTGEACEGNILIFNVYCIRFNIGS